MENRQTFYNVLTRTMKKKNPKKRSLKNLTTNYKILFFAKYFFSKTLYWRKKFRWTWSLPIPSDIFRPAYVHLWPPRQTWSLNVLEVGEDVVGQEAPEMIPRKSGICLRRKGPKSFLINSSSAYRENLDHNSSSIWQGQRLFSHCVPDKCHIVQPGFCPPNKNILKEYFEREKEGKCPLGSPASL